MKRWALAAAVLMAGVVPVAAQPAEADDLEIRLVTFGPGPLAWEHFGHNALWVRQPSRGLDVLFNYGIFDTSEEGFVATFIRGRMLYIMAGQSPRVIDAYARARRSVWIQDLNLTDAQRVTLRDFLLENAKVENRAYRYHYYYDNCSTRIRDALDHALGGRIAEQIGPDSTGRTFRFHTQRLTVQDVPLYTGLLIGLGNPVDREMTVWEEMFLPLALRDHLRDVTVFDAEGNEIPLIASEVTVNEDDLYYGFAEPPAWLGYYLVVGLAVAGGLGWLGRPGGGTARRVGLATIGGVWALLTGLGGTVLALLWAVTDHNTSYWNENLFFLNPVALVLVVTMPLVAFGVRRLDPAARAAAWVVAAGGVVGWAIQVLPGFDQVNGQVIALFLPGNLALAWTVLVRTGRSPSAQAVSTA